MFGWMMRVAKAMVGGARGYVAGMEMVRRHVPSFIRVCSVPWVSRCRFTSGKGERERGGFFFFFFKGGRNTFISGPLRTPHHGFPFEELAFALGAEVLQERQGVRGVVAEFLEETLRGWAGGAGSGRHVWRKVWQDKGAREGRKGGKWVWR